VGLVGALDTFFTWQRCQRSTSNAFSHKSGYIKAHYIDINNDKLTTNKETQNPPYAIAKYFMNVQSNCLLSR